MTLPVIRLKDGRRVFDHSGEHAPGGRVMAPVDGGERYGRHRIEPWLASDQRNLCATRMSDGARCLRSIHLHLGRWRHAKRPMRQL